MDAVWIRVTPVDNGIRIGQVSQSPGLYRWIIIVTFHSISFGIDSPTAENKKETAFQHHMVIQIKVKIFTCISVGEGENSNDRSQAQFVFLNSSYR